MKTATEKERFQYVCKRAFRKEEQKQENVEPAKVTVNLAMDDDGFVDHSVAAIASMLQKGRSVTILQDSLIKILRISRLFRAVWTSISKE